MSWLLLFLLSQDIRGTLAPDLIPADETLHHFRPATPEEREPLSGVKGELTIGKIRNRVAYLAGPKTLYVDLEPLRKFDLTNTTTVDIPLPLPGPAFKTYPVRITVYDSETVGESPRAMATGTAKINGRDVPFEFEFDRIHNTIHADNGHQTIDGEPFFLKNEHPVFHAAGAYFSIRSIDATKHEFTLEPRPASEYTHISLKPGEIFPDFQFTDLDGHARKLSDYPGRVLLDFWATWCAPCIKEIPKLRELHSQGLTIIGMNVDRDPSKPRAFDLPWPQATLKSIEEIVEHRARIQAYPTYVLLDENRRIISLDLKDAEAPHHNPDRQGGEQD